MILLNWDRTARFAPGTALVFGTGLIGSAVLQSLRAATVPITITHFNWTWPNPTPDERAQVHREATARLALNDHSTFTVLWAAGQSGFGTDTAGMQSEREALATVLDTARIVGATVAHDQRQFLHLSSAGGLFEGQICCDNDSQPDPLRPYGFGKLDQERIIASDPSLGHRHILRPSSVYGYARSKRRGLFTALAGMALQRRTATIMGALTTQRDYVFAADIGRYIADLVIAPAPDMAVKTSLLASGRPAMICEVIDLIEAQFGGALLKKIDPRPENARHNTFSRAALPPGFKPTNLNEGIALTVAALSKDYFRGAI